MAFDLSRVLPYLSPVYSAEETAPLLIIGANDGPIVRSFSNTLVVNYMIDEPGARLFVRERDVAPHAREELHARALENLRRRMLDRKVRFEMCGPAHRALWDGQHDASLLLVDDFWERPAELGDLTGELVAAVPSHDVLLFTGSTARGGVPELRANIARASDRALSPELFVRRGRAWETFGS